MVCGLAPPWFVAYPNVPPQSCGTLHRTVVITTENPSRFRIIPSYRSAITPLEFDPLKLIMPQNRVYLAKSSAFNTESPYCYNVKPTLKPNFLEIFVSRLVESFIVAL